MSDRPDDAGSAADEVATVDSGTDETTGDDGSTQGNDGRSSRGVDVDRVVDYVQWGGLLALALLAVIAGAGLYSSLSSIIDVWVARQYQPLARAAFNFAVLCVALAGIVGVLGRLRPDTGS